jgi:2-methylcitrate dehydratase PrpD
MEVEKILAGYILETKFEQLPPEVISVAKRQVLSAVGTTIAGAQAEGCEAVVDLVKAWGGRREATVLMYGGKIPAYNAVFANSLMARALDYDDAMEPGLHMGASSVITGFAVSERIGGCNGKEFLTALIVGGEAAARLNLSEWQYDGFDPTGVCGILGVSAVASRLLGLDASQTVHALALAFTRGAGSIQSNIDGALAAKLIQGCASREGLISAELAEKGITGPENFLEGVWGYFHLYGKNSGDMRRVVTDIGERFELTKTMFKKYPSCAATFASTDAILWLSEHEDLSPGQISRIDVAVTPYVHKMVGHQFRLGATPRVNAQFSIQYCVANALVRKQPRLEHFDEERVRESVIMGVARKVFVEEKKELEHVGHTAAEICVQTTEGKSYRKAIDIASGFPGNPLEPEDDIQRFSDCVDYARGYFPRADSEEILRLVDKLENLPDVRRLIELLDLDIGNRKEI